MKKEIKELLSVIFWGAVTASAVYTVSAAIKDLRDPQEKARRKKMRDDACNTFNKVVDKSCEIAKNMYRKVADFDEKLDNMIPPYGPEYRDEKIASLKAKRDYIDRKLEEISKTA